MKVFQIYNITYHTVYKISIYKNPLSKKDL